MNKWLKNLRAKFEDYNVTNYNQDLDQRIASLFDDEVNSRWIDDAKQAAEYYMNVANDIIRNGGGDVEKLLIYSPVEYEMNGRWYSFTGGHMQVARRVPLSRIEKITDAKLGQHNGLYIEAPRAVSSNYGYDKQYCEVTHYAPLKGKYDADFVDVTDFLRGK